jgi:hypothetical protein
MSAPPAPSGRIGPTPAMQQPTMQQAGPPPVNPQQQLLQERLAYEQHVKQMKMIQQQQQQQAQAQAPSPAHSFPLFAQNPHLTSPSVVFRSSSPPPPAAGPVQPPKADYPSFSVSQSHPRVAHVLVKSQNFDPLRAWMPWIDWDGCWLESFPLQTIFRVSSARLEMAVQTLMARGFYAQQSRLAARM